MTIHKNLKKLFAVTVLGSAMALNFSSVANAAPSRDVKEARKEVKDERKDVKAARKDVRKADTPQERREAKQDVREERRDVKDARKDLKQEKREDRRDNNWNHRPNNNYRPNYNFRTFTGTVVGVDSNRKFQLRVGNETFDVSANSQLPRGFSRGDIVRVYGVRSGSDDINNASLTIVNNR